MPLIVQGKLSEQKESGRGTGQAEIFSIGGKMVNQITPLNII
jgi:hypothetical protein